jgi:phospholipid/cholesterol/gamma-HCH transport system ATP-binding protein
VGEGRNHKNKPYLALDHVSISFGNNHVLNDVSFNVSRGETVCILGRSGVGKSVCMRMLMGLLQPHAGRVIAAETDITGCSADELEQIHKRVTMVFQGGALFDSLSVAENVAFPLRERGDLDEQHIQAIVDGLLDLVAVNSMRDLLPSDLSTGMKRSVAVARALALSPECILYDEPTTMVDPLTARHLGDLIAKLKYQLNLTSVVVTHDMRLAQRLADRVIFLDSANIIFCGTVEQMRRSPQPIVRKFLELDSLDLGALLQRLQRRPLREQPRQKKAS